VAGRPFLFYQLELLQRHGARRVVLCVGYLGQLIANAVGDGSDFGLHVEYSHDGPTQIGTAAAVRKALPQLGERFMVLYGDTYLRIDYAAVARAASASRLPALMTVLRNEGRWDTSNVRLEGRRVACYDRGRPDARMAYIDYGLSVMEAEAVLSTEPLASDLGALFSTWARTGRLAAYVASDRFFEIGTPSALAETTAFLGRLSAGTSEAE
jgi:NDP-sugar pyrophosphorylase family protein